MRRLATMVVAAGLTGCARDDAPLRHPPVVITSPVRLPGVVVRGAARGWWKVAGQSVRHGDPVPVGVTMYCLQGTTKRGRYVRQGIIAADPRFFPLSRFVELYAGRTYLGRFLVDDTGRLIKGSRIDVWTANCRDARRFGIQRGTAVLVDIPRIDIRLAAAPRKDK